MTLDLSVLPEPRRARVLAVFEREAAAVRIREVYPHMLARYQADAAFRETAAEVAKEFKGVTVRWVRRVIREGR